ncbi:MAG: hypothetical protein ACREMK_01575 [Gemmatimonadota bacterium]
MNLWAAATGVLAVAVWMTVAPPWRDGARGILRAAAAAVLLLGLFDVSCRLPGGSAAPRLRILIDRSESMRLAGASGGSREAAARAWLDEADFRRWSEGWQVEVDSFGGATSDPGGAVELAAEAGSDAVLVVTDGRVSGGRSIEPAGVPVYAFAPQPLALADAAVLGLNVAGEEEAETAVAVVAAVGGVPVPAGRVELSIDGRPAGSRPLPPLEAGERRVVSFPLISGGPGHSVVTARVAVPDDPVSANDARSLVREPAGPRRALAVALGPTWDFATWIRALRRSHPGPVDAYWSFPGGGLRSVEGGRTVGWASLGTGRYAAAYLFGDPDALGSTGRTWLERFLGSGGRGLLWAPSGGRGELPGAAATVGGTRPDAVPSLTDEGRAWLSTLGATVDAAPDGGPGWPALEELPAATRPESGATVLLAAGGSPVAWIAEKGTSRRAVILGTGYYRWPLESGSEEGLGAAFWGPWSDAIVRWLASASPAIRPLVRLPPGRVVPASEPLVVPVIEEAGPLRWRVDRSGQEVARGELAAEAASGIVVGPLPPGEYRLRVEGSQGRAASEPFVVERWSPELAWTAADTAGLAASTRRSGGAMLGSDGSLPELQGAPGGVLAEADTRRLDLGTWPWTFLIGALLVLADWAIARPRRR